jgi:5-methylcytosine-specific restriction endonuclease McrA
MSTVIVILFIIGMIMLVKHTNKKRRLHGRSTRPVGMSRTPPMWMKQQVYIRDHGMCRHCGVSEYDVRVHTGRPMEYDHIIPWSKGGMTTVNNLQLLCPRCNSIKSNRFVG